MLNKTWKNILNKYKTDTKFLTLIRFIKNKRQQGKIILPENKNIFNAFKYCSFNNLKVVIIGQDPYYNFGQANGLAFSVNKNYKIPPSLLNIYKEIKNDLGIEIPKHGDLTNWCNQGVLLLNTVLTVEYNKANSHQNIGWEYFTDNVVKEINKEKKI